MSGPLGSSQWMYASDAGFYSYSIDQSLRFDDASNAYLNKTYSTAQTNTDKITASFWFKLSEISTTRMTFLHARNGGGGEIKLNSHKIYANLFDTGYDGFYNNSLIRDPSAWYHLVYQGDSTLSTAADRNRVWLNGVELDNNASSYTPQNQDTYFLRNGLTSNIGKNTDNSSYDMDGYMAEIHVIDGSIVDVSNFGETSNGVWVPKAYSGSYGNNGFYLSFADSSAIGDDLSGNTNDFTATNLAAHDVVPDSPTNNFPTINRIFPHPSMTFSEGNLRHTTSTNNRGVVANILLPKSGKWYWEHWSKSFNYPTDDEMHAVGINVPTVDIDGSRGGWDTGITLSSSTGQKNVEGTRTAYDSITGWAENQGCAVLFDADANTISWSVNGGSFGSTVSVPDKDWIPFIGMGGGTSSEVGFFNFGQDGTFAGETTSGGYSDANGYGDFKWQPPSDALALCTANLPEPTIGPNSDTQADDYFNTVLYTGNATARSITGVGFQPDWVWFKNRSAAQAHNVFDVNRGTGKILYPDRTDAEGTTSNHLNSFDSDGFTIGTATSLNGSGNSIVAWNWKAGGTAVSNTDGSTTSSVSANTDAGFSILTYTADAATGTIGHGLDSAPELVIAKPRNASGTNWYVMQTDALNANQVLNLDNTSAAFNPGENHFNDTYPTSTVVSYGGYMGNTLSGDDKLMYCFHSVEGYSKIGSFEGNASASDGPFVWTGFAPSFVMGKAIDQTGRWWMYDSARSPQMNYSIGTGAYLAANLTNAEAADSNANAIQLLSNGFKVNTSNSEWNGSGLTYIYLAFAKFPFKYANAR